MLIGDAEGRFLVIKFPPTHKGAHEFFSFRSFAIEDFW